MARFNRILITGAAGNLGGLLRRNIGHLTDHIRITDWNDLGEAAPGEELVQCDVGDVEAVLELTRDVDMVLHFGGTPVEKSFDEILNANIRGFYNLYEGCRKNGVKRVVWGSSNHAIGFTPRTQVIDASAPTRPDSNYGVSKVFGEGVAQYYWDKYRVETVSIRIGSCLEEPRDIRMLHTWLSIPDFLHLCDRSLTAPRVEHTIVYGVSDNDGLFWDNRLARHLGYRPKDNAEIFRAKLEAAEAAPDRDDLYISVHGGRFASAGHYDDD